MSGIAAIIRFDGGEVEPGSIEKITSAMAYRGPDGIKNRTTGPVALGHCMMHTTQESLEEVQPLWNENESVAVVMDGWLSNWEELRSELLSRGARLRTRSDAELVLRAFEVWGDNCPKHIDGEFAFVIWDGRRQEAFCVRDHAGLRPLQYFWDGKQLIIASDIAGVLAGPGVEQRPNRGMIAEYMASKFFSQNETIWCDVMRLPPAHWVAFGPKGMRSAQYWSPPMDVSIRYESEDAYVEHYRELIADCVRRASRSHLPLACEVSGGLDSSAVFAMVHHLRREGRLPAPSVKGYTLIFAEKDSDADEIAYARAVGKYVGEEICEVPPFLPELPWFQSRGLADRDMAPYPNGAMGIRLWEAAVSDGCKVVLNGSGGDEWLDGSPIYFADDLAALNWRELYRHFREDVDDVGFPLSAWWLFRFGFAQFLPQPLLDLLRKLLIKLGRRKSDSPDWLSTELRELLELRRTALEPGLGWRDAFRSRRGISRWLNDRYLLLARDHVARLSAHHGFDYRSPMYARRIIEFAFSTPERMRSRGGISKFIHRKALAGLLPDVVLNRATKSEFSISFSRQLDGMRDLLVDDFPRNGSGNLDGMGVARLFDSYRAKGSYIWELWGIFGCENALGSISPRFEIKADKENAK